MRRISYNKLILEPFPDKSVKTELLGEGEFRVAKITNTKTKLISLKVLQDCLSASKDLIPAGSTAHLRANEYSSPWGKEVLEDENGQKFIVVPFERVEYFTQS